MAAHRILVADVCCFRVSDNPLLFFYFLDEAWKSDFKSLSDAAQGFLKISLIEATWVRITCCVRDKGHYIKVTKHESGGTRRNKNSGALCARAFRRAQCVRWFDSRKKTRTLISRLDDEWRFLCYQLPRNSGFYFCSIKPAPEMKQVIAFPTRKSMALQTITPRNPSNNFCQRSLSQIFILNKWAQCIHIWIS